MFARSNMSRIDRLNSLLFPPFSMAELVDNE